MELEEAIKTLKDFAKYGRYYSNNTEHHMKTAINTVLNHLTKQEKMIELIKTRIFVSSEEHEQILKIQEKHRNKSYEDCTIEYFEKKAEES